MGKLQVVIRGHATSQKLLAVSFWLFAGYPVGTEHPGAPQVATLAAKS